VLEPFQQGSGAEPLTVARHVEDLHDLIQTKCAATRPALVGSSWGAMLALAYAASHPDRVGPLVLVGCGTFDPVARGKMRAILEQRINPGLRRHLERLGQEISHPDERLRLEGELILPLYSYELVTTDLEIEAVDARAHDETWEDMLRSQEKGVYPAALASIDSPVLMLHGEYDPHPGRMIRKSLEPLLTRLEYLEWECCGHYPWLERAVRHEFFAVLREWLGRHAEAIQHEAD
jgi:pimeloyl-ACP methyl ester carboxylesterase